MDAPSLMSVDSAEMMTIHLTRGFKALISRKPPFSYGLSDLRLKGQVAMLGTESKGQLQ